MHLGPFKSKIPTSLLTLNYCVNKNLIKLRVKEKLNEPYTDKSRKQSVRQIDIQKYRAIHIQQPKTIQQRDQYTKIVLLPSHLPFYFLFSVWCECLAFFLHRIVWDSRALMPWQRFECVHSVGLLLPQWIFVFNVYKTPYNIHK